MPIGKKQVSISFKIDTDYKDKITKIAEDLDQNVSEFIRMAVDNEISQLEIGKNQSYLYEITEHILTNILDQKLNTTNQIIKRIYIQQELIIEILKHQNSSEVEDLIRNFMTSYNTGESISTVS